jgi:transglutaminase-like putative cysteine protease
MGLLVRSLGWLVRRLGPRTLLVLSLLLVALGSVAFGLADAIRGLDAGLLLPVAMLGLLFGWGLAKSPLPGWMAGLAALGLGIEVIFLRVGRLGGRLLAVLHALVESTFSLVALLIWEPWRLGGSGWAPSDPPDGAPIWMAFARLSADINTILVRLRIWALAVVEGEPAYDLVAVALGWSVVLWTVAVWASWFVRRRDQPLTSMTPAGVLLGGSLFFVRGNPGFLLPLLAAALCLTVFLRQFTRERRWEANGVDFPFDVGLETAFAGAGLSLLLVVMAMLMPSISVHQMAEWAGQLVGRRASEGHPVASSLGLDSRGAGPETIFDKDHVRAPGLPQRHLLGSGPELSERVVMVVFPKEDTRAKPELIPGPANSVGTVREPRYYWRSLSYDEYTGRGWITERTEMVGYQAGELAVFRDRFEPPGANRPVVPATSLARQMLQVELRAVGDLGELLYAAGDLVTVDQEYQVAWRSPDDAFGATTVSGDRAARSQNTGQKPNLDTPIIYQANSLVAAVGEAQLRAAGSDYPLWVQNRYLSLPDTVPARVLGLARDLTATAPTPYDRAISIESFLRTFPYSLELPSPPLRRDVVDYFLFDLKEGYCDYYATAMVVLARAAGLPARLAVGYFSGTYDEANHRYIVTEADAHSWVEIYFPSYGWVDFEPTAGRAPIDRPANATPLVPPELAATEPMDSDGVTGDQRRWVGLVGLMLLAVLGATAWSLVDSSRLHRASPKAAVATIYWRLMRHGRRLAVPMQPGDTPYEFTNSLSEQMICTADSKQWGALVTPGVKELRSLADLYVQTCYGRYLPDAAARREAIRTWQRLRRRLWLVWIHKGGRVVSDLTSAIGRRERRVGRLPTG